MSKFEEEKEDEDGPEVKGSSSLCVGDEEVHGEEDDVEDSEEDPNGEFLTRMRGPSTTLSLRTQHPKLVKVRAIRKVTQPSPALTVSASTPTLPSDLDDEERTPIPATLLDATPLSPPASISVPFPSSSRQKQGTAAVEADMDTRVRAEDDQSRGVPQVGTVRGWDAMIDGCRVGVSTASLRFTVT
jgi:hypothetical protein